MDIILASKSPRRKELLSKLGFEFKTMGLEVDETITSFKNPQDYVKQIVLRKGQFANQAYPSDLVICADTIVVCDNNILEKPKSKEEARQTIQLLSGKTHQVLTAVCIVCQEEHEVFIETTEVEVIDLLDCEIEEYISTSEPYDKAGAYGIQGSFAKYISKINGDYYNVMGMPLCRLNQEIKKYIKKEV